MPIYKDDDQRGLVLPYCESLKAELEAQTYDGAAVRVRIDDRDIRGGEKKWQWVKRGVPVRLEIGPRDVEGGKVALGRRDIAGKPDEPFPARDSLIEWYIANPGRDSASAVRQSSDCARGGHHHDRRPSLRSTDFLRRLCSRRTWHTAISWTGPRWRKNSSR